MAHNTSKAGFPNIILRAGMKLVLEARDPTTDAAVTGVTCSRWSIYGEELETNELDPPSGPFMLVPGPAPVGNPGDGADIHGGL